MDTGAAVSKAARPVETVKPSRARAIIKGLIPVAVAVVIALLPVPANLKPNAWYYFALFIGVIVGLMLEPIPPAAIGLLGVVLAGILGLVEPKPGDAVRWALSGFGSSSVWLIFAAFMFSLGYAKTGLGRRVALTLVKFLGGKTVGLGYAITFSDLILAPFTPSNTARSAGTIYPIVCNIPGLYGCQPGPTARKIGAYLMWTALAATCITSSIFSTAMTANLLALDLLKKTAHIEISWTQWFMGFLPVGVFLLIAMPYLVYKIYPPEIKTSKEVPPWAAQELAKLGKVGVKELIMAAIVIVALVLWIFGQKFIDPSMVALVLVCGMVLLGIINWDDVVGNKQAWNVLIWFATLVTLAEGLSRVGFAVWFAKYSAMHLSGLSPLLVMIALVALFFGVHYLFASVMAHTAAILPVIVLAGASVPGVPVATFALLLSMSLGLMGIITPYATGPSPVYFGSGYVPRKDFWVLGFVFGLVFLAALLLIGIPYNTLFLAAGR
jgi:L-tartrate/succinate antiporter